MVFINLGLEKLFLGKNGSKYLIQLLNIALSLYRTVYQLGSKLVQRRIGHLHRQPDHQDTQKPQEREHAQAAFEGLT